MNFETINFDDLAQLTSPDNINFTRSEFLIVQQELQERSDQEYVVKVIDSYLQKQSRGRLIIGKNELCGLKQIRTNAVKAINEGSICKYLAYNAYKQKATVLSSVNTCFWCSNSKKTQIYKTPTWLYRHIEKKHNNLDLDISILESAQFSNLKRQYASKNRKIKNCETSSQKRKSTDHLNKNPNLKKKIQDNIKIVFEDITVDNIIQNLEKETSLTNDVFSRIPLQTRDDSDDCDTVNTQEPIYTTENVIHEKHNEFRENEGVTPTINELCQSSACDDDDEDINLLNTDPQGFHCVTMLPVVNLDNMTNHIFVPSPSVQALEDPQMFFPNQFTPKPISAVLFNVDERFNETSPQQQINEKRATMNVELELQNTDKMVNTSIIDQAIQGICNDSFPHTQDQQEGRTLAQITREVIELENTEDETFTSPSTCSASTATNNDEPELQNTYEIVNTSIIDQAIQGMCNDSFPHIQEQQKQRALSQTTLEIIELENTDDEIFRSPSTCSESADGTHSERSCEQLEQVHIIDNKTLGSMNENKIIYKESEKATNFEYFKKNEKPNDFSCVESSLSIQKLHINNIVYPGDNKKNGIFDINVKNKVNLNNIYITIFSNFPVYSLLIDNDIVEEEYITKSKTINGKTVVYKEVVRTTPKLRTEINEKTLFSFSVGTFISKLKYLKVPSANEIKQFCKKNFYIIDNGTKQTFNKLSYFEKRMKHFIDDNTINSRIFLVNELKTLLQKMHDNIKVNVSNKILVYCCRFVYRYIQLIGMRICYETVINQRLSVTRESLNLNLFIESNHHQITYTRFTSTNSTPNTTQLESNKESRSCRKKVQTSNFKKNIIFYSHLPTTSRISGCILQGIYAPFRKKHGIVNMNYIFNELSQETCDISLKLLFNLKLQTNLLIDLKLLYFRCIEKLDKLITSKDYTDLKNFHDDVSSLIKDLDFVAEATSAYGDNEIFVNGNT